MDTLFEWPEWRVTEEKSKVIEEYVQQAICDLLPSISTSDFRVQLLLDLNPPHVKFHPGTIVSFAKKNQYDALLAQEPDSEGQLLPLKFHALSDPGYPFSYMGNIPTLGCIVNLRSAVARFLRHLHPPQNFRSFIRPHVHLSSGPQPPSGSECLRLIACCGLHCKLLSKLFGTKLCSHGCSSFTSSILRRVSAKLAAATIECEALSVIAWCRQAFDLGLELTNPILQHAANAMSQLALSTNGRLALVSCGACELLVDIMLSDRKDPVTGDSRESVKGCEFIYSKCQENSCECDYWSCVEYHCYVGAALCLASCTAGAYSLNRAGWNPYWVVVREYHEENGFGNVLIEDLRQRGLRAVGVPPVVWHFPKHFCECVRAKSRSEVLLSLPEASIDSVSGIP